MPYPSPLWKPPSDATRQEMWTPPAPPHSQPWAGWVDHSIKLSDRRTEQLEAEVLAIGQELERRRAIIDEAKQAREQSLVAMIEPLRPHMWKLAVGFCFILYSWMSTGRLPAIQEIRSVLGLG